MYKAFEIIGYGKTGSDCTSEYILKLDEMALVRDVIKQILENKREWGYIGIKSIKDDNFGLHAFEYKYGNIQKESMSDNEKYFWRCIENYQVISIEGSGGWTRSDYKIEIQSR